jgi:3'-phosphoadenosine 5'-phosphosulfate (PAPS) 3'-phosphatase
VTPFALAVSDPYQREVSVALDIADQAAALVLAMQASATRAVKHDGTIVTAADLAAAELIRERISAHFPDDAILTEEDSAESDRLTRRRCWIIDPIDGTQQFADGLDDYDIFVALAVAGQIEVAATVQPPTGVAMVATTQSGLFVRENENWRAHRFAAVPTRPRIGTRFWLGAPDNLEVLQPAVEAIGGMVVMPENGIGPRSFLGVLDAVVALYMPGSEPQGYEWDIAPLDLFVRAGGGWSTDLDGQPLRFNKADPRFPDGILMAVDRNLGERLLEVLTG